MRRFIIAFMLPCVVSGCGRPTTTRDPAVSSQVEGPGGGGRANDAHADADPSKPVDPKPEPGAPADDERVPMVSSTHPFYARLEAPDVANACTVDGDCHKAGCGGEVCSAEKEIMSTCEVLPIEWPAGSICGCVRGQCVWSNPAGAMLESNAPAAESPRANDGTAQPKPSAGARCGNEVCKPTETCIEYYGIAGPNGPAFQQCGIRCEEGQPNSGCPKGMRCVTIADGPGSICR